MNSRQTPHTRATTDAAAGDGANSVFLLRPLTVALFVVLLAGQFSFDRLGIANPLFIPERLFGLGLLTFLVVVVGLANIKSVSSRPAAGIIVAAPVSYFLVTSLWGADVPDFWGTVTDIVCMLLACVIISILLSWDCTLVAETILWCLAITGIIFSVAGLTNASIGSQVSVFGGGPNVYSRVTMLGFIALVGLVAMRKLPIAALAFGPVMIVATVVSGSRGGMLAGLVSICVLVPILRRLKTFQIVGGLGLLVGCMVFVYQRYADTVDHVVGGRIVELTLQQGYTSGRGDLFGSAWGLFLDNLVRGAGLGGFEAYYGQGYTYPHNLLLLTASEGGLIGLTVLIFALVTYAVRILRHHGSTLTLLFAAASCLILTAAMFSGGYYDSRFLWVFMIIAMHVSAQEMSTATATRSGLNQ